MLAQPRGRALAIDINGVAAGALLHFPVPACGLIRILVEAMVAALVCPAENAARVLRSQRRGRRLQPDRLRVAARLICGASLRGTQLGLAVGGFP